MPSARFRAVKQAIIANVGFLFMVTIWGAMFPALERILRTWDVFSATAGRHTLAVIALLLVLSLRERRGPHPSRAAVGPVACCSASSA